MYFLKLYVTQNVLLFLSWPKFRERYSVHRKFHEMKFLQKPEVSYFLFTNQTSQDVVNCRHGIHNSIFTKFAKSIIPQKIWTINTVCNAILQMTLRLMDFICYHLQVIVTSGMICGCPAALISLHHCCHGNKMAWQILSSQHYSNQFCHM